MRRADDGNGRVQERCDKMDVVHRKDAMTRRKSSELSLRARVTFGKVAKTSLKEWSEIEVAHGASAKEQQRRVRRRLDQETCRWGGCDELRSVGMMRWIKERGEDAMD